MNISNYVKTLQGVIAKDSVINALEAANQDFTTKVQVILCTAESAFKTMTLKSKEVIGFDERYRTELKLGRNVKLFTDLQMRMDRVVDNLETLRQEIIKTLPETVSSTTIDYRSASLMQLVSYAGFLMRFTRRFIETATIYETEAVGMYEDYQKNNLNRGEAGWIDKHFMSFLDVLRIFSDDKNAFKKKFDTIPNVQVDPDEHTGFAVFGQGKMDPFRMGIIPVSLNPAFHIGKWWAEFQAWRYKEAQDDLMRIQRRIMLLEEAQAGNSNPKVEAEIKILRDKSEGLTYKINKAEEEIK